MSLFDFSRLLFRNINLLIATPLLIAAFIFLFTINQEKQYASSALVYTGIASGFNIESGAADKVDYHAVNNAFDNLISIIESKQTKEEVSIQLLARHLATLHDNGQIPAENQLFLKAYLDNEEWMTSYNSLDLTTIAEAIRLALATNDPVLIAVLRTDNSYYGTTLTKSLEVKRHKSSDMLKLYFTSSNTANSKLVLELIIEVFTSKYRSIKVAETGDVVDYFQQQLDMTLLKLKDAEDRLTAFRTKGKVINYGEQTKAIAIKKQNALEEYSNKKMSLLATQVALEQIEDKLKIRGTLLAKNKDLLKKRNELTRLVHNQTKSVSAEDAEQTLAHDSQVAQVTESIKADMEEIYSLSNSKEGLPNKQLLNEWLQNIILLSKEESMVANYQIRLKELDGMYQNFAPMGSTLARLEREINVAEREYLGLLNSINMSKLRQQNIQLSSKLEVVDWPQLPLQPLPSKRALLIGGGLLLGLFTVVALLIAIEMLDGTISSLEKAQKASGIKVVGAFPVLNKELKARYPLVLNDVTSLLASSIASHRFNTKLIILFSAYEREGKTTVGRLLSIELQKSGILTRLMIPGVGNQVADDLTETYEVSATMINAQQLQDLGIKKDDRLTILELPALSKGIIPWGLIRSADQTLMIARADQNWSNLQSQLINEWEEKCNAKPQMILNGLKAHHLEAFSGDLTSHHGKLINWAKNITKLQFNKATF
ncbi:MAG: succinoglycan biosynthesis transport protein ExoP [Cyclobacteriaceae bacterium]|jgi:succinoglycan biosynthesis transport protein ExoP